MLLTVCAANGRAVTCGFFEKTSRLSERQKRVNRNIKIGRMSSVNCNNMELNALRMILNVAPITSAAATRCSSVSKACELMEEDDG